MVNVSHNSGKFGWGYNPDIEANYLQPESRSTGAHCIIENPIAFLHGPLKHRTCNIMHSILEFVDVT
jgi:hypothetical protein